MREKEKLTLTHAERERGREGVNKWCAGQKRSERARERTVDVAPALVYTSVHICSTHAGI